MLLLVAPRPFTPPAHSRVALRHLISCTSGGRETYVVDADGTIAAKHNNQFDPASHVGISLEAAKELKSTSPGFELPAFELPDFSTIFSK